MDPEVRVPVIPLELPAAVLARQSSVNGLSSRTPSIEFLQKAVLPVTVRDEAGRPN